MKKTIFTFLLVFIMMFSFVSAEYPSWTTDVYYNVGDIVNYNGQDYICIQAHTSLTGWQPPNVPALWNTYIDDYEDGYNFVVGYAYQVGDVVSYNDIYYKVIQAHTSQSDWTPNLVPALFEPYFYFENNNPVIRKNDIIIEYQEQIETNILEIEDAIIIERDDQFNHYYVYVDSDNYPNLNKEAKISVYETNFNSTPVVYKVYPVETTNGTINMRMFYNDVDSYNNITGDVEFTFSSFSGGGLTAPEYFPTCSNTNRGVGGNSVTFGEDFWYAGNPYEYGWYMYKKTSESGWYFQPRFQITSSTGQVVRTYSGLSYNTDYNWGASHEVSNSATQFSGDIYGCSSGTFTTGSEPLFTDPTIISLTPTLVDDNSARLRGEVTSLGDATTVYRYFEFWETGDYATTVIEVPSEASSTTSTGIYTQDVSSLDSCTDYSYTFHIEFNEGGWQTISSSQRNFKTTGCPAADGLLEDLVSYWKFDETTGTTASDSHGTNDETVSGATWTTGKLNNGLDFDGTNDYISTSISPISSYSYSFWFKLNEINKIQMIIEMRDPITTSNSQFYLRVHSNNKLILGTHTGSSWQNIETTNTLSSNTWYFITITYDTTNNFYLYINGNYETQLNYQGTTGGSQTLKFGKSIHPSTPSYFDGILDEVGYWSRALSSDEVSELYNSGNALSYDDFEAEADPVVVTNDATDILWNSAQFNGEVTDLGEYSSFTAYFIYSTDGETFTDSTYSFTEKALDVFSATQSGLESDTNYEYKACIYETTDDLLWCGESKFFKTLEVPEFDYPDIYGLGANAPLEHNGTVEVYAVVDALDYDEVLLKFYWKRQTDVVYSQTAFIPVLYAESGTIYEEIEVFFPETIYDFYAEICFFEEDYSGLNYGTTGCIETSASTFITGEGEILPSFNFVNVTSSYDEELETWITMFRGIVTSLGTFDFVDVFFQYKEKGAFEYIELEKFEINETNVNSEYIDYMFNLTENEIYEAQFCLDYYVEMVSTTLCTDIIEFSIIDSFEPTDEPSTDGIVIPPGFEDNTEFGEIFNTLTGGSSLTKMLMGFFLVIAIIFMGVSAFGQYNMNLGTFGIMIFMFIGTIIATVLGLFPIFILILILLGGIIMIVLKQMFFNGGE